MAAGGKLIKLGGMFWDVTAKDDKFHKSMGNVEKRAQGTQGKVGRSFAAMGKAGKLAAAGIAAAAVAIVAGLAAIGKGLFTLSQDWRVGVNEFIIGTGKMGEGADAAGQHILNLMKTPAGLGRSMGDVGAALAEVDTRLGLTGQALESFTGQALNLTRLTKSDTKEAIRGVSRVMGDWGISNEKSGMLMDTLFRATQNFGVGLDSLTSNLVRYGAPMRQMGFSMGEAIALMGKWEQEGVNLELVLSSLRIAAGKFAEEGVPLRDGLLSTIETIKNAKTESEGLSLAMEVFGSRAGADMAAAIREGRFELDEAINVMRTSGSTIDQTVEKTLTLSNRWELMGNSMRAALAPIGTQYIEPLVMRLADFAEMRLPGMIASFTSGIERMKAPVATAGAFLNKVISNIKVVWAGNLLGIRSTATRTWKAVADIAQTVGNWLKSFWAKHGQTVARIWHGGLKLVGSFVMTFGQNTMHLVEAISKAIKGDWSGAWTSIRTMTLNTLRHIIRIIIAGFKITTKIFKLVTGVMRKGWQATWDRLNEITGGRLTAATDFIKKAFTFIVKTFAHGWDAGLEATKKGLTGILKGIGKALKGAADTIARWLDKIPMGLGRGMANTVRGAGNKAVGVANEMARKLGVTIGKFKISAVIDKFESNLGTFTDKIKDFADEGMDDIEKIFDLDWGFAEGALETEPDFIDALKKTKDETEDAAALFEDTFADFDALLGDYGEDWQDFSDKLFGDDGSGSTADKAADAAKQTLEDTFAQLQKSLAEGMALIDWKLEQGVIDPVDAIRAKISALTSFMEAAFKGGFVDAAADAAAQIKALGAQLAALETQGDAVKSVAEAMEELKSSVENSIDAVAAISIKPIAFGDLTQGLGNLENMRPHIEQLFTWMHSVYDDIKDLAPEATVAADLIAKITAPIKGLVEGMEALYNAEQGTLDGILTHTRPRLVVVFEFMKYIWGDIDEIAAEAITAAEVAGKVVAPLQAIMDGMAALYQGSQAKLDGILTHTRPRLVEVIKFMAWVYDDVQRLEVTVRAQTGAEAVGKIIQPVKLLMDGMAALYQGSQGKLAGILTHTKPRLIEVFKFMDWVWTFVDTWLGVTEGSQAGAEAIGKITQPLKTLMDGMNALYTAEQGKLAGILTHTKPRLIEVFKWLSHIWLEVRLIADDAEEGARSSAVIGDSLTKIVNGLTALTAWRKTKNLYQHVEDFRKAWEYVLEEFTKAKIYAKDVAWEEVAELVKLSGEIADGLQKVTRLLADVADYTSAPEAAVSSFLNDYTDLLNRLAWWFGDPAGGAGLADEITGEAADNANKITVGLDKAMVILTSLAEYVTPTSATISSFVSDVARLLSEFDSQISSKLDPAAAAVSKAWGESVGVVATGMGETLETLTQLYLYVSPARHRIDAFLGDVKHIFEDIAAWAVTDLVQAGIESASAVGESLSIVMKALADSFSLFEKLATASDATTDFMSGVYTPGTTPTSKAAQVLGYLYLAITNTFDTFYTNVVQKTNTEWLPAAEDFFTLNEKITGTLRDSLALFEDVDQHGVPDTQKVQGLINAIVDLFQRFATEVGNTPDKLADVIDPTRSGSIIDIINSGAERIEDERPRWGSAGDQLIRGLEYGLTNDDAEYRLSQAAVTAARTLMEAMEEELGIESPSKRAMAVTEQVGRGLELGFVHKLKDVQRSAADLANATMMAFNPMQMELAGMSANANISAERRYRADIYIHGDQLPPEVLYEARDFLIRELELGR